MRSVKAVAAIILSLILAMLAACSGSAVPDTPESIAGSDAETAPKREIETETETQTETETKYSRVEPGEREDDPSEEEINDWAYTLYRDALGKLSDEGAIPVLNTDDERRLISFTVGDGGKYIVEFLDPYTEDKLTAGFEGDLDLVITGEPGSVYYTPYRQRRSDPVPFFFPKGTRGEVLYNGENTEIYADSLEECRYFICYAGFAAHTDEDFYGSGTDREIVTTVVFIIDAVSREVVHIEVIGSDVPGAVVEIGKNRGVTKYEEAEQYILSLLDR